MSAGAASEIERTVRALQRGADAEASAGGLHAHCFPPVYRFFRRRGFAPDRALDLTRRSLLEVYRGIGGFGFEASFDRWLFEVVESVWKEESPPAAPEPAEPAEPAEAAEAGDRVREVAATVGKLPGRMRQCALLRFGQGFEPAEIASLLKIRPATATSQLHNAARRLLPHLPDLPEGIEVADQNAENEAVQELIRGVLRAMTEARGGLREPPTPGELIGYVRGARSVPERRRIEDWIVADPEVARTVLDLRTFPDLRPAAEGEEPHETERSAAWEAMREALRAEGLLPAEAPRRAPAVAKPAEPAPMPIVPAAEPVAGDEPPDGGGAPVADEWFEASESTPPATSDWFEVSRPAPSAAETAPAPEPAEPAPVAADAEEEGAPGEPVVDAEPPAAKMGQPVPPPPMPAPNPAARWGAGHVERVRPAVPRWAPPLAAVLAATTLGLAIYLGWLFYTGQVGGGRAGLAAAPEAPRLNPVVRTLLPEEAAKEGTEAGPVAVARDSEALVLVLGPSAAAEYPAYRVEIYNAVGEKIFARNGLVRHPDGTFSLAFPRLVLVSGRYRIVVVGVGSGGERPLAIYDLRLAVE